MKNKKVWIPVVIVVLLAGIGFFFRDRIPGMASQAAANNSSQAVGNNPQAANNQAGGAFNAPNAAAPGTEGAGQTPQTTAIRLAAGSAQVSAAGNIAVVREHPAIVLIDGTVAQVNVEVGDTVIAGDRLVEMITSDLERAITQAELNLASNQAQLDKLMETANPAEIASAEASMTSALESLAAVQAGPRPAEIAAAEANLAAARERYNELQAGPSEAELIQLRAALDKTRIDLQQAQADYDRIAFNDDAAARSQAATLQQVTIDYEAAQAAYDVSVEPASQADLQAALSDIQNAQDQLETLKNQPTAADLASAHAQVASAQAQLEQLLIGPSQADLRSAEISVEQAQLELEEAQANLAQAQIEAPISGTVLAVNVSAGERVTSGSSVVTLADLTQLQLSVNVAEVDVSKLQPGQSAEVTIDALPDQVFNGVVTRIAPASDSEQGVVNYPVTVQLVDLELTGIRPGMTAVASILDDAADGGWLVPTSAIIERNGNTAVLIMKDGQPRPIPVTKQGSQGEWTIVQSPDLQAGDEAVGGVSSFVNQEQGGFGGGFGRGFGGARPPGGGSP